MDSAAALLKGYLQKQALTPPAAKLPSIWKTDVTKFTAPVTSRIPGKVTGAAKLIGMLAAHKLDTTIPQPTTDNEAMYPEFWRRREEAQADSQRSGTLALNALMPGWSAMDNTGEHFGVENAGLMAYMGSLAGGAAAKKWAPGMALRAAPAMAGASKVLSHPYVRIGAAVPAVSAALADLATRNKSVARAATPRDDSWVGKRVNSVLGAVPFEQWYGDTDNAAAREAVAGAQALQRAEISTDTGSAVDAFNGLRQVLAPGGNLALPAHTAVNYAKLSPEQRQAAGQALLAPLNPQAQAADAIRRVNILSRFGLMDAAPVEETPNATPPVTPAEKAPEQITGSTGNSGEDPAANKQQPSPTFMDWLRKQQWWQKLVDWYQRTFGIQKKAAEAQASYNILLQLYDPGTTPQHLKVAAVMSGYAKEF